MSDKGMFGIDLARLVAGKLRLGKELVYNHRDYCGYGFFYKKDKYYLALSHDGQFLEEDIICGWSNTSDFITFLSHLNNYKCSGKSKEYERWFVAGEASNQRITKSRLLEFIGEYAVCPMCAEILRGPKAKSCPHCGENWYEMA